MRYREALSPGTPVRLEQGSVAALAPKLKPKPEPEQVRLQASVTALKPRKCVIEWELLSLSELDRKGAPVRHAFGSADFLLARK